MPKRNFINLEILDEISACDDAKRAFIRRYGELGQVSFKEIFEVINKRRYHSYLCGLAGRDIEFCRFAVKNGFDINSEDEFGNTPLIYSFEGDDLKLVKKLIKLGADVNKQNKFGETALQRAVNANLLKISKFLINNGAYLELKNCLGCTAIFYALDKKDMFDLLLESGADIRAKDNDNMSLLDTIMPALEQLENILKVYRELYEKGVR